MVEKIQLHSEYIDQHILEYQYHHKFSVLRNLDTDNLEEYSVTKS